MNKISFPLKLGDQGSKVADLQDALKLCLDRAAILANDEATRQDLSARLQPERAAQTYGEGTQSVVSVFQKERGLTDPVVGLPSGQVDEPTANVLNALLQQWGMLDQPPAPGPIPAPSPGPQPAPAPVPSNAAIDQTIAQVIAQNAAESSTVSTTLNTALKASLIAAASASQQTALVDLLQTLKPADLLATKDLSLRDFVARNTTLPSDPAANQPAQAAIASLSSVTTVGALLGLDQTVAANPLLRGIVAQANLGALLSTSPALANPQLQTDFMNQYVNFQGSPADFWTSLSQNAQFQPLVPELQFTMQLGFLTLNNPSLVTALRNSYKPSTMRDLTKVDATSLAQLITSQNISIPDDIPGATPAEKAANYAGGIIGLLKQAFPTEYVTQGLAASKDAVQQATAGFLANSPDFDFQTTKIDAYIQQNSAKSFRNISPDQIPVVTTELKGVQRVFRVSSDFGTIDTLLSSGLDSAAKITATPQAAFIEKFSGALGPETAQAVYANASHITAQALNVHQIIQNALKPSVPHVIADPVTDFPKALASQIPNWQTLFGSTSSCECEECGSVLGPAAYFVDLLQFLRNSKANAAGFTPLDVLIGGKNSGTTIPGRRPDLQFIKLNCENADTTLPYIDLVNEILESYIVNSGTPVVHNTPSDATADELSVNPEYTQDAAYTRLSQAIYPLNLPYDRFLDEARRYLSFLGANRLQIMQAFNTSQPPVDESLREAAEALGLNEKECELVSGWSYTTGTAAAATELCTLYGYPSNSSNWEQQLGAVPEFLQRTGLSFDDLVKLLETQYLNPGQTITISSSPAAPCDITQMQITPLDDTTLAKILPFIRLWRKLGWTMADLDKVIAALGPKGINRGFLLALADVNQLQSTLNLPLNQLLTLWSNIDRDGRDSLYISLFQNKAVLNPVDTTLQLGYPAALSAMPGAALPSSVTSEISYDAANKQLVFTGSMTDDQRADLLSWATGNAEASLAVENLYQMRWAPGTEIASQTATITDATPSILAALRLSADDLNSIRTDAGLLDTLTTKTRLNLANLSQLFRYVVLARGLGLSIPDVIGLKALTGVNPFALGSADPVTVPAMNFVQIAQTVQSSRFSVGQLNYIYRAISNPAVGLGPLQSDLDQFEANLESGLQKIIAANVFLSDPSGKLLRQKLGAILDVAKLGPAMDLISGTAVYTTPLTALPTGLTFPQALSDRISFDASNQQLRIVGPMTDNDLNQLLPLSNDSAYTTAVNDLYQQPRTIISGSLSFLNPTDAITQLIDSPSPDVADGYNYVLKSLLTYLQALQSRDLVKQMIGQLLSLDAATVALLLTDQDNSPALLKSQNDPGQPAIIDFLNPAGPFPSLARLYPIASLISTFSIKATELGYLSAHGQDFSGADPNNAANTLAFDLNLLPVDRTNAAQVDDTAPAFFNQWQRLNDLFGFRNVLPTGNVSLFDIFQTAAASSKPSALGANTITAVLAATGWDAKEFTAVAGKNVINAVTIGFGLTDADFKNETGLTGKGLVWLKNCFDLVTRLGISADLLFQWANQEPDGVQAQNIKSIVKAKYDDATWLSVGKPLNDGVRTDSRDALVPFVLNLPSVIARPVTDADELYEFLLIDVQMSSCMLTSRIVQASAAIQLFVQRCLMNLENDNGDPSLNIAPDAIDAGQWEWRKNYRVWQANREIFLWPENWSIPSLRDNKTPFFEELETELLQGELTADRAETAYHNYLLKLQEVARLEICGLYWEKYSETDPGIIHVFGRTFAIPHVYYYRKLDRTINVWSPWEKVDADIEGDHLVPVVWNRRLHIFWPLFKETTTPVQAGNSVTVPNAGESSYSAQLPLKTLEIQLAWSEYRNGAWTKKQVTSDALTPNGFTSYSRDLDKDSFFLRALPSGSSLEVRLFYQLWIASQCLPGPSGQGVPSNIFTLPDLEQTSGRITVVPRGIRPRKIVYTFVGFSLGLCNAGWFVFDGCSPMPNATAPSESFSRTLLSPYSLPSNTFFQDMSLVENVGDDRLRLPDQTDIRKLVLISDNSSSASTPEPVVILNSAPGSRAPTVTRYSLQYPQQFAPNYEVQADAPYCWQPFFYEDSNSTYFVTNDGYSIRNMLTSRNSVRVLVTASQLNPSVNASTLSQLPIFAPAPPEPTGTIVGPANSTPVAAARPAVAVTGNVSPALNRTPSASSATGATPTAASVLSSGTSSAVSAAVAPTAPLQRTPAYMVKLDLCPKGTLLRFATHWHPHICDFIRALNGQGISGLLTLNSQKLDSGDVEPQTTKFQTRYQPTFSVGHPYPTEAVDFSPGGSYSIYNWELFFHIPFLIATKLSQNQKFEDAQKWFHYIFNPTSNRTDAVPGRFWNVLPFSQDTDPQRIEDLLQLLDDPQSDPTALANFENQIAQWENNPFDPDVIARLRLVAYQKAVVMKYLDNLIAWGDNLYAQNTRESINEATQLYVLAQQILGDRPVIVPNQGYVADQTYSDLRSTLDDFSDAFVELENLFPFSTQSGNPNSGDSGSSSTTSVVSVPYFCVPPNDTLLGYWDIVAKRLYQIRHCMNLAGQVEQLPLFAPPINPALLVEAKALGMDLSSALGDINASTPYYRFTHMVQKALELCAEVRSLGAALLAALEKSDGESLSLLRATQEKNLLNAISAVKKAQIDEANANLAALNDSYSITQNRQQYYDGLIAGGWNAGETAQLLFLTGSMTSQLIAQSIELAGADGAAFPYFTVGVAGFGGSPITTVTEGGGQAEGVASLAARALNTLASTLSAMGTMSGITAAWDRRQQEWTFQAQTASLELKQITDQIQAATIRQNIAVTELQNHELQLSNAADVEDFLRSKYTNQELYDWMVSQVSAVFFQCYQMAYDFAKRAEACFVFERVPDLSNYAPFIQFGYWDSLKKGLLSGERLYQDLKRLEIAYLEQNQRDYEISKSISLLLLDPRALINLKETGQCIVQLPEAFFDMDYPGHYLRRVKSLSLTIPCVVGPYTSVNCTLTLLNNRIRVNNAAADPKDYVKDSHFLLNFAATQSIATSTAQNDSGLFEVNFRDERYLPFEGAGVTSTWQLSMPPDTNAFDFETITDVIFNLKYTARDGGSALRDIARQAATMPVSPAQPASLASGTAYPPQTNLLRFFSLKHEFPTQWYQFLNPADLNASSQIMTIALDSQRFPFQYRGRQLKTTHLDLFLSFRDPANNTVYQQGKALLPVSIGDGKTSANARLNSVSTLLSGIPFASLLLGTSIPASLTLTVAEADVKNLPSSLQQTVDSGDSAHQRLNTDAIDDIFLVCYYSAT